MPYYRPNVNQPHVLETKDAIKKAYKALRKQGFITRSNFWCCQGCGCSAIGHMAEKKGNDPAKQKYVFYHRQDHEQLVADGTCFIAWGGETDGTEIKKAFEEAGLCVDWDGTKRSRFEVHIPYVPQRALDKLAKEMA